MAYFKGHSILNVDLTRNHCRDASLHLLGSIICDSRIHCEVQHTWSTDQSWSLVPGNKNTLSGGVACMLKPKTDEVAEHRDVRSVTADRRVGEDSTSNAIWTQADA